MIKKHVKTGALSIGLLLLTGIASAQYAVSVTSAGARGDGKTLDTRYIQQAIDQVAAKGGGTVISPAPGVFMSGTIHLRSNINLEIEAGATLLGSPDIKDYDSIRWGHNIDRQPYHLVYADSASNCTISGKGVIDGNGIHFWQNREKDANGAFASPRWLLAKPRKVSPLVEIR